MKTFNDYLIAEEHANETPSVGDVFEIEMARDETLIETTVVEVLEDGIVINADDAVMKMFEDAGYLQEYNTGMPAPSGGSKSAMGSAYKKANTQQSKPGELAEGKMKELLGDINELTHDEFSGKYNMSKDEAREKFDIKDEEELDEMSAMRRLAGMMQDKENIKNTRIPGHDERRIQVDLIDLTDEEFEAKHKMSKAEAGERFNEASDASAEEEDDFHTELDDLVHKTFGHSSDEKKKKKKSNKPYDLYHKTFSDAMQHAYAYAMENLGIEIDPNEIDNEVAMGPPKPATGKTNSYRLLGKDGKKAIQVQVYNTGNSYELNMYKEQINEADVDKGYINIGGARVKADKASILQHFKKTFPNVTKIKKDPQHGWVPVFDNELDEAEYQGREVTLNKPTRGDVKKSKVYVKDPKTGNVKKVNFGHGGTSAKRAGQKTMSIKKSDPARRKSFRARHNCDNPGPKTSARYWSCRAW